MKTANLSVTPQTCVLPTKPSRLSKLQVRVSSSTHKNLSLYRAIKIKIDLLSLSTQIRFSQCLNLLAPATSNAFIALNLMAFGARRCGVIKMGGWQANKLESYGSHVSAMKDLNAMKECGKYNIG